MNNSLLSSIQRLTSSEQSFDMIYDPLKNPPNLKLAELHRKATKVGKIPQDLSQQLIVCPCCDNIVNKIEFGILCDVDEFAYMGVGYTLFFVLYRYFAVILLIVFIITGGAFFLIVTFQCTDTCVKFYGIPIMSDQLTLFQSFKKNQIVHILTAVFILGLVISIKFHINYDIQRIEQKIVCPSQYTIMIQNLPVGRLDIYDFKKWIYQKFRCAPILINIAYETSLIVKAKQKRQQLAIQKNTLKIKMKEMIKDIRISDTTNSIQLASPSLKKQIQALQQKIREINKVLEAYYNNQIQRKQIGTGFVTFNKADEAEKILQVHQKTLVNILLQKLSGLFYPNKLQYKGRPVFIYRAPAPKQIIWQNLKFSQIRNLLFQIVFIVGMVVFIFLTFQIQFWFSYYMYSLRHTSQLTGRKDLLFQALIMSVVIMVLNIILRFLIQFFTSLKRSYSYTKQQSSFCSYYSLIFIINSCFTVYIVHRASLQSSNKLLLIDIHTIMLTNAFSEPLFKLFNPMMWIKIIKKIKIEQSDPSTNPYPQSYIQKLWEGYEIQNADNYQYIIRVLFITVWFSNIAPLGILFSLMGMLLDYWIVKILFIKVYRYPHNLSKNITKSLNFLELLPLVYVAGILPFLYNITFTLSFQTLFNLLFHYGITIVIILFCILGYLYKFRPKNKFISDKLYCDVDLAFGFNYQTQNPFTKFDGQKRFLEQILKKQGRLQTQKLAQNILNLHSTSPTKFQEKKSSVNKLKINLSRRITSNAQIAQPIEIQMKRFQSEDSNSQSPFPFLMRSQQKSNF